MFSELATKGKSKAVSKRIRKYGMKTETYFDLPRSRRTTFGHESGMLQILATKDKLRQLDSKLEEVKSRHFDFEKSNSLVNYAAFEALNERDYQYYMDKRTVLINQLAMENPTLEETIPFERVD